MNNLKDELERIDIPTELRARAKQGIEQAAKEQESEPTRKSKQAVQPSIQRKLLVGAFTTAVTAAAALFIVAVVNPDLFVWNTANGAETAKLWYSKWLIIPVLSVLLIVLLYGTFKLIRKFPNYKGLTIFGSLMGVYCLGVGIWYSANMFQERVVLPIAMEFVKGQDGYNLSIGYVVDRFDESTDMEALIIDGIQIELDEYIKDYLKLGHSFQIQRQNLNHTFKIAHFTVSAAQLENIVEGGADLSNSEVLFLDGTTAPIQIEHFSYSKDENGDYILREKIQNWTSSGTGGGYNFKFDLKSEPVIKSVSFPQHPLVNESYELTLDGQVIKRVSMEGLEDIDLLPVAATNAKQLTIRVGDWGWDEQLLRFHFPLFIHGEQMIYKAEVYNWELHQFDHKSLQDILN